MVLSRTPVLKLGNDLLPVRNSLVSGSFRFTRRRAPQTEIDHRLAWKKSKNTTYVTSSGQPLLGNRGAIAEPPEFSTFIPTPFAAE